MSVRIGKSLEAAARVIRPFLLPSHRRSFAALLARGLSERRQGEPIVCCDFSNSAIDAVGGRYYFSLVHDLIYAGYFPVFTARRGTLSTFGTSPLKSLLLPERLGTIRSLDELKESYFLITDDPSAAPKRAEKVVTVDYEWRVCRIADEIAFPFFMHPWTASIRPPQPEETSTARLFFGGNTEEEKYDKDVLREVYHMLTRREMLEATAAVTPAFRPQDAASWLASPEFHPFVLCETQHCKIPQQRWLEALGKADFFLACPGVGMPLCHNLIEALAAGSIPILQYAAYLPQPLKDKVNCLAFSDAESLRKVIGVALAMSPENIRIMRANVRQHYEEFLAPGSFAKRLISGPYERRTLLLNSYRVPR